MSHAPPDLTGWTDTEVQALLDAATTEQARRAAIAAIPTRVTSLASQYVAAGGDAADLTAAVDQATNEETM